MMRRPTSLRPQGSIAGPAYDSGPGVIWIVFGLWLALTLVAGAQAQTTGGITLEVFPNAVQFPADGSDVRAVAVLHNGSDEPLLNARPRPPTDGPVTIRVEGGDPRDVGPNSDATWNLCISRTTGQVLPTNVHLIVDYQRKPTNKPASSKVVVAVIGLSRPEIESVNPAVTIQVQTDIDKINSGGNGTINVVLTNKTATAMRALVNVDWPESLKDSPKGPFETQLSPQGAGVVPVRVLANRRVRVGKQLVIFNVQLEWGQGPSQRRNLVESREISVDVLIASPLLQLFGAPLILFLPGFLALETWSLLWALNFLRTRYDPQAFPLKAAGAGNVDFYLVAVLISFVLLGMHESVGWDYVTAYGLPDLVLLYFLSVGLYGGLAYVAVMLIRRQIIRGRIPAPTDDLTVVLRKLYRQGLSTSLFSFERGSKDPKQVFVLEPLDPDRPKTWIGPPIKLRWKGDPDEERKLLEKEILDQLNTGDDANKLADLLWQARDAKKADIRWEESGGINRPTELETKEIPENAASDQIVQFE